MIARINGAEVRQSDLALAEEDVGPNIPAVTPEAKRDWLINYMTDMLLLAQHAEAQKVQEEAEFKRRLAFLRDKALMESLLRDIGKTALTPEAMRSVYNDAVKQIADEQEVHARHILFRVPDPDDEKASKAAEDKAKAALAQIKKGEDFAAVAKELTEDPPGKQDGGDLGYFTKDQMVPEFAEKAFSMEKGQVPTRSKRRSAGTSSRSRTSASARRPSSTRSRTRSRPSSPARPRSSCSTSCASRPRSSGSTSRPDRTRPALRPRTGPRRRRRTSRRRPPPTSPRRPIRRRIDSAALHGAPLASSQIELCIPSPRMHKPGSSSDATRPGGGFSASLSG
ncbi:MAG: peptidylprolyl isomerase [Xanthobacteraceae bacterium]